MQCILSGNQYFKILPTKSWRQFGPKNFHNNISLLNGLQLMINVTPRYLVIHHRAGTTKGLNVSLLSLLLVWGGWSHTVTTAKLSNHIYLTALLEVGQEEIPFWVRSGVWLWWHVHSLPKSSDTNKIFNTKIHQIDLKEWQDLRLTCSKIDVKVNTEWQNVSGQHTSWRLTEVGSALAVLVAVEVRELFRSHAGALRLALSAGRARRAQRLPLDAEHESLEGRKGQQSFRRVLIVYLAELLKQIPIHSQLI